MFNVRRPQSLRLQAVDQIRHAIVTGQMEPGSLHSEQAVASRMGISRTPVREALLQLTHEGLVEFVPHRGARVRDFDPVHLSHVFELRAAMESYCAACLARKHTADMVTKLEHELDRQLSIIKRDDGLAWVIANMDFHILLVSSLNNNLFDEAMPPLASHTMRIGYRMNARKERMKESHQEHSEIVKAIRNGDEEKARALTASHLYVTAILMKQLFSDLGDDLRKKNPDIGRRKSARTSL